MHLHLNRYILETRLIQRLLCLLITAIGFIFTAQVSAQSYPNRPIRLVVPFPPGGGTDLVSRELAASLTQLTGWSIVVENRPGAGGNLGVDTAAKSAADGYTLVMGQTSNLAINPTLFTKLPYDPLRDLAPIIQIGSAPIVLVVPANSPYKNLGDLIKDAKARPGMLNYASSGNGTVAHLAAERLQQVADFKAQHIPYKGFNLAFGDLIAGQVQLFMSSVPTVIGQIRSGKLRALAVTSLQRSEELPDTPSIAESGYPGFEAITWFGVLAPAATPQPILQQLNLEINKAIGTTAFKSKMKGEGAIVLGGSAEQFSALLKKDLAMWGQVVKSSGAKID